MLSEIMRKRLRTSRIVSLSIFVLVYLSLISCEKPIYTTEYKTDRVEYLRPIKVGSSSPIAFKKVLLRIPAGTIIGYHHDGLLKLRKYSYYSQSTISAGSEEFNMAANEELKSVGYKVVGDAAALFDEREEWKARFLLGGSILQMIYNSYAPLAGNYSDCSISVKWELMDKTRRRVVYESNTSGYFRMSEQGTGVIYISFRLAFRKLLADSKFVNMVTGSTRSDEGTTDISTVNPIVILRIDSISGSQTDIIADAQHAVVTVLTESGHASGFFVSTDGYIITSAHVVADRNFVDVRLTDGIRLQANILHSDIDFDIALLKISGSGFRALPLFDKNAVQTGQEVYAIGTPASESLAQSVTKGIVSGTRVIAEKDYIQTDVKVNPGNSGGPLIDNSGRVLGIITWKVAALRYEGLVFCVPIQTALERLRIEVK